ncbi:nucleolar complex protein 14 [Phytophthora cinnamomi]|uniref:nucleolar complex protein 14 n=1 Tax=Phytophthora cinnamomi TaxID=4785 RepID=UPI00355A6F32|nr:nucleolar complex protein 14 [Phytophthora cinnamomi]
MKPTSAETLKIYMHRVAGRVGNTIAKEMGDFFGVMFDGWSSGTRHFVAVFVVYNGAAGLCERLIGLSPIVDGQTADAHIEFIESILAVYDKDLSVITFLVADNSSTNRSVATKLNIPPIGCVSHRFILAMV